MSDATTMLNQVLPAIAARRTSRRNLLAKAAVAAGAVAGAAVLGRPQPASAATLPATYGPKGARFKVTDADILNFALNLEYLEAEFYARAVTGAGLTDADTTGGAGTAAGSVTGGAKVTFTTTTVQQYAMEIAADELAHVRFLRANLTPAAAVNRPAIDFTAGFNAAAKAAGVGATFDPFTGGDVPFLIGAYLFEDVGVTAYQGGSPYIKNPTYLQKAAGILTTEGYHAATVRTTLYRMAATTTAIDILAVTNKIAAGRQTLSAAADGVSASDEGLAYAGPIPNIVPANGNGMTYARTFAGVLNIVYVGGYNVTTQSGSGGFLPSGMNGRIH